MRGRTFKKAIIIADEMQNSSPNQMLMLTTRIGENSKMIITGDLNQTDRGNSGSGLYDFYKKFSLYTETISSEPLTDIKIVKLNESDIERSPVIKTLMEIYKMKENDTDKTDKKNTEVVIKRPKYEVPKYEPYKYNDASL
jgi:phosphate starvation-inducible PhoH-like protein